MQLRSCIATLTAVVAAAAGSGATAAAADGGVQPPVLTDNTVLIDLPLSVFNPVGKWIRRLDGYTYVVTITNPNTDAVCGVTVDALKYMVQTPLFPSRLSFWKPARSGWASHPDPVYPGESRTFTIDVFSLGTTEVLVTAGCQDTAGNVSRLVTHTINRMSEQDGGGSADFGSS